MKISQAITLIAASSAIATSTLEVRDDPCSGSLAFAEARCCSTDVLGLAALSCARPSDASSAEAVRASCKEAGGSPKCCSESFGGVVCDEMA
ncbi:hypothetical protein BST61_g10629 [Cercospora zeina]